MARLLPLFSILLLLGACSETSDLSAGDAATPPDGAAPPEGCSPPASWGSCDGVVELPSSRSAWVGPDLRPAAGDATVERLEATDDGAAVVLAGVAAGRVELPAMPALSEGDAVEVTDVESGFTVSTGDELVAFVGTVAPATTWDAFRSAAAGDEGTLQLGDLSFELRPLCAGPFERNDSCELDVGVVAFELELEGERVPLGETTVTTERGERVVDVRRVLYRDDRFASQCETCHDQWDVIVDVAIVVPADAP